MQLHRPAYYVLEVLAVMLVAYLSPSVYAASAAGLIVGGFIFLWRNRGLSMTKPAMTALRQDRRWLRIFTDLFVWIVLWGLLFAAALTLTTYGRDYTLRFVGAMAGYMLWRVVAQWLPEKESA